LTLSADSIALTSNRRSIVIDGRVTSILLEASYWHYFDTLARQAGMSWSDYMRRVLSDVGQVPNRAAAIKEFLLHKALASEGGHLDAGGFMAQWLLKDEHREIHLRTNRQAVLVGRSPRCDLVLDDEECSRVHAAVLRADEEWWLVDLDSKNGTWIERKRVIRTRIEAGTLFRVGECTIALAQD